MEKPITPQALSKFFAQALPKGKGPLDDLLAQGAHVASNRVKPLPSPEEVEELNQSLGYVTRDVLEKGRFAQGNTLSNIEHFEVDDVLRSKGFQKLKAACKKRNWHLSTNIGFTPDEYRAWGCSSIINKKTDERIYHICYYIHPGASFVDSDEAFSRPHPKFLPPDFSTYVAEQTAERKSKNRSPWRFVKNLVDNREFIFSPGLQ